MMHTNNITEQTIHGNGSGLDQETPITNNLNNPTTGAAAVDGVAHVEQDAQELNSQPGPAVLNGQDEATLALIPSHTPLVEPGHIAPAPPALPALVPAPAPALPAVPTPNVNLDPNPDLNPTQSTLLGSFQGVGGIQFADNGVPENLVDEVPTGQDVQEPIILLEHAVPNEVAFPHAPFVQPFALVQAVPAVAVAQPFMPVANNNPVQQPLLRSLRGFEGIQFEGEGEDEDP
ncbi:hypothetical protein FRC10_008591 [Ceratobasidium sp. 414]|nr:hypothetical protein FRC10_008591 [Ceratobasidium sp. 414]